MSNVIQALEDEVKAIGESITKHSKDHPDVIGSLLKLQAKVEKVLLDLKAGIDLQLMCNNCKLVVPACEFDFTTIIQECPDCGNHIKIEATCPKCNKTRTIYRDRNYEGD